MAKITGKTNEERVSQGQSSVKSGAASTAAQKGFFQRQPRLLAVFQGLYYVVTGLWAIVDLDSFEAVTGPKTDGWLVKTVGVLVTLIGAVLFMAGLRRRINVETVTLAVGSAGGLAAIDTTYAIKGRISPIYLLDALAQIFIVALWYQSLRQPHSGNKITGHD